MKKIINGKRYDTETATEVASFSNSLGQGDFRNLDESLYITKSGNFFLSGEGGPMTKYSRPAGNMTSGGSDLIPLSKDEALDWLESHDFPEEIEKYFTNIIKDA